MSSRFDQARQLSLYLLLPAAGFLSPLLVIPAVSHRFGAQGWSSMAVAQSLGGSIGVATEMGWGVVGPQRVAGLPRTLAIEQYRLSLTSRLFTAIPGMLIAACVTFIISNEFRLEAAVLALALSAQAMTPSWYFIGVGKPLCIFWSESFPRLVIAFISGISIYLGAPLMFYSVLMLASVPTAQYIARRFIGPEAHMRRSDWKNAWSTAKGQTVMGIGRGASVVYTALPITLVQLFSPGSTAVFAASERLMRMSIQVLGTVPLRFQSWIGSASNDEKELRIKKARHYLAYLGAIAGIGFAVLAPSVARFVFSGAVHIPYHVSAASGLLLFVIMVSTSLGLTLVAQGRPNDITRAILPSAVVGIVTIGPLAAAVGPVGALGGELLAEVTGLSIQRRRANRPLNVAPRLAQDDTSRRRAEPSS